MSSSVARFLNLTPSVLRWALLGLVCYTLWSEEPFILLLSVISFIISLLARGFARKYPDAGAWDFVLTVLLFFHTFLGITVGFYEWVPFYDKALHFIGAVLIALSIWKALVFFSEERRDLRVAPLGILTVVALTFSLGGLWEILEFSIDGLATLPQPAQVDLCDTMCDLIANLAGALLAAGLLSLSFNGPTTVQVPPVA